MLRELGFCCAEGNSPLKPVTGMRGAAYREDEVNITVNLNVIHRQSPKLVNDEFCLRLKQMFFRRREWTDFAVTLI